MIVKEKQQFADVFEYAAYLGAFDAATGLPPNTSLFCIQNETARLCRLAYDLAFLLEKESNIIRNTAVHTTRTHIIDWNDLLGYGTVKIDGKDVFFNYLDLKDPEIELYPGCSVTVIYRYIDSSIKISLIK